MRRKCQVLQTEDNTLWKYSLPSAHTLTALGGTVESPQLYYRKAQFSIEDGFWILYLKWIIKPNSINGCTPRGLGVFRTGHLDGATQNQVLLPSWKWKALGMLGFCQPINRQMGLLFSSLAGHKNTSLKREWVVRTTLIRRSHMIWWYLERREVWAP